MGALALLSGFLACTGACDRSKTGDTINLDDRHATDGQGADTKSPGVDGKLPRLVVMIVVDQLPSWSLDRDLVHMDGGIARLAREGAFYPYAQVPFAITYTAPGHTALGTGAPPSVSKILANGWYHIPTGTKPSATFDPTSPVFTIGERPKGARLPYGASSARMAVDGLSDVLRTATQGKGKSIAISLKDRGAILAAGRKPDLAIWYDSSQRAMTTSAFYASAPPAWLRALASDHPVPPRMQTVWTLLPNIDHAAITGIADAASGEAAEFGMGNAFPHALADSRNPARELRSTPLGDDLVLEAAYAALAAEQLGLDDVPDLLSLSFSAHDYAGHNWGQESWERLDLLLRLDDKLGELLNHLDTSVGAGNYAVVFTSDHGATPLIERSIDAGKKVRRITHAEMLEAANAAASGVLGDNKWFIGMAASTLYGSPALVAAPAGPRGKALDAVVTRLQSIEGLGYVARTDQIAGGCDDRTGVEALACRSVVLGMSGSIYYGAGEYYTVTRYKTGTGHGTYTVADRQVPLVVFAPGWSPGRVEDVQPSMLQIAPTIATLLGIPELPAAQAPALKP